MSLFKSKLHEHISEQQARACQLVGVLEAIETLDNDSVAPNAVTALIGVALNLACELDSALDTISLPNGDEP